MTRVLVVDDQPDSLQTLHGLLTGHGYVVDEARHGAEALIKARQSPPHLVVSDVLMPVMDGYALLREWRADERLQPIPFVVHTATCADPEDEALALALGADAFIRKPAEPGDLLARLADILGQATRGDRVARRPQPSAGGPVVPEAFDPALVRKLESRLLDIERRHEELRDREARRHAHEIALREEAEARLAASERRFRGMIEKGTDAVVLLDARGTMVYRTAVGPRIFGHADDAVLGHTFGEFIHPDDLPAISERFARMLGTPGDSYFVEFRYRRPDGHWGYADATVTNWLEDPDIGAVVVNAREITVRKNAEARAAGERRLRELLLESVGDGVHGLDAQGRIIFENAAALQMFGWGVEEMRGQHAHTLVHHHHADGRPYPVEDCPIYQTLGDGRMRHVADEVFFRRDGSSFPVEYTCNAMRDAHGRIDGVVVSFRDITARRQTEAALEENRQRYEGLFENTPVAVWLEDFSPVRARLAELGLIGQDASAIGEFFARDDAAFQDCVARVRVLQANRACLELHAASDKAELVADLWRIVTDESRAALLRQLTAVARGQTALEAESKVRTLNGHLRDVHLRWVVMPGHERTYGRVLVTTADITARRQTEARVAHLTRLYATRSEINQAIVRVKAREELFPAICRAAVEYGQFEVAWIGLLDRATQAVTTSAAQGTAAEALAAFRLDLADPRFADSLMSRALATGRLACSRDMQSDPALVPWRELAAAHNLRSAVAVPFRFQEAIVGFLVLASADGDYFADPELQSLVTEVSTDVSFALDAMEADAQRRRAELAEAHERALAEAIIQSLPGVFYLFTAEGRFVRWNEGFQAVSGYTRDEIARLHPLDFFTGEDKDVIRQRIGMVLAEGASDAEAHFTSKDGTRTPYYFTGRRVLLDGRPHVVGMGVDLVARRQAETSLRDLAHAVDKAGDVVFLTDKDGIVTQINEQFTTLYGYPAEEVVGKVTPRILKSGRQPLAFYEQTWATLLQGETVHGELVNRARDGRLLDIEETITPFRDERGGLAGFLAVQREVGARKRAEAEVRLLHTIAMGVGAAEDLDAALTFVLRQVCATTGWAMGEAWLPNREGTRLGCHSVWYGATPGLEEFRQVSQHIQLGRGEGLPGGVWQTGRPEWMPDVTAEPRFNRSEAAARAGLKAGLGMPVLAHGEVVLVLGFYVFEPGPDDARWMDLIAAVTAQIGSLMERKQVEAARAASEAHFRSLIENASDLVTVVDAHGTIRFQGPSSERLLGFTPGELTGRRVFEWIHPDDAPRVATAIQRALESPGVPEGVEFRFRHKDGSWRTLESMGRSIVDAEGDHVIAVNSRDVTEHRRLEGDLRQAQRMDAIGHLAGGVAHDFTNVLAVITMQTELMQAERDLPAAVQEGLRQLHAAAERGANLTRQLLLFSRKQVIQSRDLDLNDIVASLARMLQRIIGEDVRLQLHLHPAPLLTRADAGMLDQVLMNLAVNARDAMPTGGSLRIETTARVVDEALAHLHPDASPGRYVCLRVSDTGVGIPPEILPRVFEPFFTTKEPGKGTGLGLATVFGIVKQHRGWIHIDSEPGRGTSFQVCFPALAADAVAPRETARPVPRGGTETILLVEDDPAVRRLAQVTLERHGYHVVTASSGADALRVWPSVRDRVALVLTDLVMPDAVSGHDLAQRLRAGRADLKVIYMSGYSAEIAGRELALRVGENFLQKPFPIDTLLEAVRRSLDE